MPHQLTHRDQEPCIGFHFQLSFSLLGFSYFINRELALGIWVFYLLTQVQQGIFNVVGIQSSAKLGWFSNPRRHI